MAETGEQTSERNLVRNRKWRAEKNEEDRHATTSIKPVLSTGMVSVFWFFKFGVKYALGLGIFVRLD